MKEDLIIARSEWPHLSDLHVDEESQSLVFFAKAAPHERLRCTFESDAIAQHLVPVGPDDEGNFGLALDHSIDDELVKECVEQWRNMASKWDTFWPGVYAALLETRVEYGNDEEILPDSPLIQVYPPEDSDSDEPPHWSINLEMPEWDGQFYVAFQLDGEILYSGATF